MALTFKPAATHSSNVCRSPAKIVATVTVVRVAAADVTATEAPRLRLRVMPARLRKARDPRAKVAPVVKGPACPVTVRKVAVVPAGAVVAGEARRAVLVPTAQRWKRAIRRSRAASMHPKT